MKKYYAITPMNQTTFIGEFEDFRSAWDFVEYESNIRYVWIISENSLKFLNKQFNTILGEKVETV